ncbi:MAG: two pore domain potassium channel family protein [Verrucomicrobia bacterium]|nr:two pore domain potassium channel family protein [Verrucomicrobiota bacterium]
MNEIAQGKEVLKPLQRRMRFRRFSTVQLLIALALLFFSFPFVEELEGGDIIVSILLSLVLLAAVVAVAHRKGALLIAVLLLIPAIGGRWINHFRPDLVPAPVFLTAALILIAFIVANLLHFVLRAPSVNAEVLCASISAYLMLGLMWTVAYWLVDQLNPEAFAFSSIADKHSMRGFNAFYFSFITLSTVGYGDITPVTRIARWLAAMEAMTGLLYVAVLIARLVSLYSSARDRNS